MTDKTQTTEEDAMTELQKQAQELNMGYQKTTCPKHPHITLVESNLVNQAGDVVGTKMSCSSCLAEETRKIVKMPSRKWREKNVCTRKD